MKITVLFLVLSWGVTTVFSQSAVTLPSNQSGSESDEKIDESALPKEVGTKIAHLHAGLKRSEIENDFEPDGGMAFGLRYFVRSVSVHHKRVTLELSFQLAGMPDDVYADPDRTAKWRREHDFPLPQPTDVLRRVGKPFLAGEHID